MGDTGIPSKRVLVSWSTGKDSAWMLHQLRQQPDVDVVALLTSFNQTSNLVAMHAIRRELAERQATELGLPLWTIELPWPCSNDDYEKLFADVVINRALQAGITHVAFGDLFLTDIREYRIQQFANTGLEPIFPIWCDDKEDATASLAREIINSGFEAIITCIDSEQLSSEFLGRHYDLDLLRDLPKHVDPCGERGEFHTFCFAGPSFQQAIRIQPGVRSNNDRFHSLELALSQN